LPAVERPANRERYQWVGVRPRHPGAARAPCRSEIDPFER